MKWILLASIYGKGQVVTEQFLSKATCEKAAAWILKRYPDSTWKCMQIEKHKTDNSNLLQRYTDLVIAHDNLKDELEEGHQACVESLNIRDSLEDENEQLRIKLKSAIKRMDRARNILTDGNPTPTNNWGMLDTTDLK